LITTITALMIGLPLLGQVEERGDTTAIKFGKTQILIIGGNEDDTDWESVEDSLSVDSIDVEDSRPRKSEAHWSGVSLGLGMMMARGFDNSFPNHPYWKNDPARSQTWELNLLEKKFNFGTPYVGLTTGLGFRFDSYAFNDNYLLQGDADTIFAVLDTNVTYSKNKLKASYVTIPLLLEFNTSHRASKSFYLATGVIGGVRMTSKTKRVGDLDGKEFKEKNKGTYTLNPFRLDATVRMGYSGVGVFANYSLLPLFDEGKTVDIYPLTFGLSFNF